MKRFRALLSSLSAVAIFAMCLLASPPAQAQGPLMYVSNGLDNTVQAIDPSTGHVVATIPVGTNPYGEAINGQTLYVVDSAGRAVSVIDTSTNSVTHTIPLLAPPYQP